MSATARALGLCDGPLDLQGLAGSAVITCRLDDEGRIGGQACAPSGRDRHATELARLCVGTGGVAPGAPLYHAEALEGGWVLLRVLRAIEWLIDQSIAVLLLPIGVDPPSSLWEPVLAEACRRDILVVAPVGNRGPGRIMAPAHLPFVLSIGAIEPDGRPARFSGGAGPDGPCRGPDAVGPYQDLSTVGGTSTAAAWAAGHALALRRRFPGASAAVVRTALLATARPGPELHRSQLGRGTLAPDRAAEWIEAGFAITVDEAPSPCHPKPFVDRCFRSAGWLRRDAAAPILARARPIPGRPRREATEAMLRRAGIAAERIEWADSFGTALVIDAPAALKALAEDPGLELVQLAGVSAFC